MAGETNPVGRSQSKGKQQKVCASVLARGGGRTKKGLSFSAGARPVDLVRTTK